MDRTVHYFVEYSSNMDCTVHICAICQKIMDRTVHFIFFSRLYIPLVSRVGDQAAMAPGKNENNYILFFRGLERS